MDSSQGSSFIPKSPVSGTVTKRRVRKVYVFTYIIFIFFIGSLLSAGATWFYKLTVENNLNSMRAALNEEQNRFNQSDLERISELHARLNEAKSILVNQVSVVEMLRAIEAVTVSSVSMKGLRYVKELNATLALDLSATARDFNTTLFQRQVLASSPVLAGAAIEDVAYAVSSEEEGAAKSSVISFTVVKDLSPLALVPQIQAAVAPTEITPVVVATTSASSTLTTP